MTTLLAVVIVTFVVLAAILGIPILAKQFIQEVIKPLLNRRVQTKQGTLTVGVELGSQIEFYSMYGHEFMDGCFKIVVFNNGAVKRQVSRAYLEARKPLIPIPLRFYRRRFITELFAYGAHGKRMKPFSVEPNTECPILKLEVKGENWGKKKLRDAQWWIVLLTPGVPNNVRGIVPRYCIRDRKEISDETLAT